MSNKKTIYIRDEDKDLVEKAQECSQESFSNTVFQALRFYIDSKTDTDFSLQKLMIGYDIHSTSFDFEVLIEEGLKAFVDANEMTFSSKDENIDWVMLNHLEKVLFQKRTTFFGKEILSFEPQEKDFYPAEIKNLKGIHISKEVIKNAIIDFYNISDKPQILNYDLQTFSVTPDREKKMEKTEWAGDVAASFKAFKTRKGKILIYAKTKFLDGISEDYWSQDSYFVPNCSDFALFNDLEELKDDQKSIITDNYKIEFALPNGFIKELKRHFISDSRTQHLDI